MIEMIGTWYLEKLHMGKLYFYHKIILVPGTYHFFSNDRCLFSGVFLLAEVFKLTNYY